MIDLADSTVLVTGGCGFLGGEVIEALKRAGTMAIFAPPRSLCDLRDAARTDEVVAEMMPDIVVHLAATVGGIGANRARPGDFFRDNMLMGMNVVEACRVNGVKKLVLAGSICSYPENTPVPFTEDMLWAGYPEPTNAPYGIAKKALLVMAQAYRAQFGMNSVFLMPVNLYGPGDDFDLERSHVVPAMIRKFAEAKRHEPVTLWGSGEPTRSFLYVRDCAEAFVAAIRLYDKPEPVNLGSDLEITIRDLALKIQRAIGHEGPIAFDRTKPDGQPRRRLDSSRAATEFGWTASTPFDDGLEATVRWYMERRVLDADP